MSTAQEAMEHVLAQREIEEKLASAREEQREAIARALEAVSNSRIRPEDRSATCWAAFTAREVPLHFEPLRIRIEEQKNDLDQAGRVIGELALELEQFKDEAEKAFDLFVAAYAELQRERDELRFKAS